MHTEMDRSEYFIFALFPSLGQRFGVEKSAIISSAVRRLDFSIVNRRDCTTQTNFHGASRHTLARRFRR